MSTSPRAALLAKIHKVLKKHYKPIAPPSERSLFEHLLYSACLENTSYDKADEIFARLQQSYFDWNEVRVSTVAELAETMADLAFANEQAGNLKRALHSVFEAHYSFDIEPLKKQNIGKAEEQLRKYQGASPFMISYTIQHGLDGHAIPIDRAAMELMMILNVVTPAEAEKGVVPGLERAIPKNKGIEFGSLLHQFAADYVTASHTNRFKSHLAEIDSDAKSKIPKHPAQPPVKIEVKKDPNVIEIPIPVPRPGVPPLKKPDAKGEAAKTAARKEEKKDDRKPAAKAAEKSAEKPAARDGDKGKAKKKEAVSASESKSASKSLAKKKPR